MSHVDMSFKYQNLMGATILTKEQVTAILDESYSANPWDDKLQAVEPVGEKPECQICFEPFNANHRAVELVGNPACHGHIFGYDCIVHWLGHVNTCPVCRTEHQKSNKLKVPEFRTKWNTLVSEGGVPSTFESVLVIEGSTIFALGGKWTKKCIPGALKVQRRYAMLDQFANAGMGLPVGLTEEQVKEAYNGTDIKLSAEAWSVLASVTDKMLDKIFRHTEGYEQGGVHIPWDDRPFEMPELVQMMEDVLYPN